MSSDKITPLQLLAASYAIASFAGLAALLRSNNDLNCRILVAAMLYSGMTGLIIALLWYNFFDGKGNMYFLLGVSGLAGIGGTTAIDFVIQAIKHGGLNVTITSGKDDDSDSPDDAT